MGAYRVGRSLSDLKEKEYTLERSSLSVLNDHDPEVRYFDYVFNFLLIVMVFWSC
jgi:hypothetical protein